MRHSAIVSWGGQSGWVGGTDYRLLRNMCASALFAAPCSVPVLARPASNLLLSSVTQTPGLLSACATPGSERVTLFAKQWIKLSLIPFHGCGMLEITASYC